MKTTIQPPKATRMTDKRSYNNPTPPPPPCHNGALALCRATMSTATPFKTMARTRNETARPAMPKRFGILSAPPKLFLVTTFFALLFVAQPTNAENGANTAPVITSQDGRSYMHWTYPKTHRQ